MNKTPAWKESLRRCEDGEWDYDRKRAPFVFKVPRAWEAGLKMIEAGEEAHRQKVAAKHKPNVPWVQRHVRLDAFGVPILSGGGGGRERSDSAHLRDRAKRVSQVLNTFAGDLDAKGYPASAVHVRRFMWETVEPVAGGQCQ